MLCPAYLGIQVYGIHLKNFTICNTSSGLFEHKSFLNHPAKLSYHNHLARVESPEVESSTEIKQEPEKRELSATTMGFLLKYNTNMAVLSYALNVQLPCFSMNTSNTFCDIVIFKICCVHNKLVINTLNLIDIFT